MAQLGCVHIYFPLLIQIVHGYQPKHLRPWMARLEIGRSKARCGGSLINHRFVLSAAHCFCYDRDGDESFMCKCVENFITL